MKSPALLIRADASFAQGVGHVMRSIALGQAWQDLGGQVTMMMAGSVVADLVDRAKAEGFEVVVRDAPPGSPSDAEATIDVARRIGATRICADGYAFGPDFQRAVRQAGPLLVIDDNGENRTYAADLVLNHHLHATAEMYAEREPNTRLLLGPSFALLRREFASASPRSARPVVGRVVIVLGGSDPHRLTGRVVRVVRETFEPGCEIVAVLGPAARADEIEAHVLKNVRNMYDALSSADLAISGAGTTLWELAAVGTPAVAIVCADNQQRVAAAMCARGATLDGGSWNNFDERRLAATCREATLRGVRERVAASARQLIDGRGARRVAEALWAAN